MPRRLPPCYVVTPRLSWEQIRHRAGEFAKEWQTETHEKGQAQSFYKDFFTIFGIKRRQVASFERRVQSDDRLKGGFIDLFWPGTLIAEHKSAGLNLSNATGQALDYFDWLPDNQKPRYILTCDFQNWRLLDLDENREIRFRLHELPMSRPSPSSSAAAAATAKRPPSPSPPPNSWGNSTTGWKPAATPATISNASSSATKPS